MTLPEFLAWEQRQESRFEFDGVGPVAMNGGTIVHETIVFNLRVTLQALLQGGTCRAFGPSLKIEVGGRIRYPDVFVACGPRAGGQSVVEEPVVVFEVLSPSTSRTDRIEKLLEYRGTASIRRYVILEQESIAATVHHRDAAAWAVMPIMAGDVIAMPELGIAVPIDPLYSGVDFPPPEPDGAPIRQ